MRGTSQGHDILIPVDSVGLETIRDLDPAKKALMWVHSARYPEHHNLAFLCMATVAEAIGTTVDLVLLSLKYDSGRFDYVELVDGRIVEQPHSIAFESMDQAKFQKFWDDALAVFKDQWKLADDVLQDVRELLKRNF
jgi:hypothetical protein